MISDKNIADYYPKISIFWLKKKGFLDNPCKGWLRNQESGYHIMIEALIEDYKPYLWLTLRIDGQEPSPKQKITLIRTHCNYDGWRFWFQCPCGKRVGILHAYSNGYFGCRKCLNMTYACRTMNNSSNFYDLIRYNKLFNKFAGIDLKKGRSRYRGRLTWRYRKFIHLKNKLETESEN